MTWHILGAGSLGCLWAARLALSGANCCLILRNKQRLQQYQQLGARLSYQAVASQQIQHVSIPAQLASDASPITNLLLACKAPDAEAAVASVAHRLVPASQLFLLQNGMGSQQQVAELLPRNRVIVASSTEGAWLRQPFAVVHAGCGLTSLGELRATGLPPLELAQWTTAEIDWQWSDNIAQVLWRKLALNCMINPLTVLHNCQNGEIAAHSQLLTELSEELAALLTAAGYPISAAVLFQQVQQVIVATAANTSSMLQDVRAKRRTEISFITGFALEQGLKFALELPCLHRLHADLQQHLTGLGLRND